MSKPRVAHLGKILVCTVLLCTLALAADQKSPTKLSDLPPEAQQAISVALARKSPRIQNFTLTASDGANDDLFGMFVAIDGNTAVAGASLAEHGLGVAYVFVKPPSGWANMTQTAELTSSDGAGCFGCSVAISGNTIVIGATAATINGNGAQGAVYVFVEPPTGWTNMTETAKLIASDGEPESYFATGLAISGDTIVAGAPGISGYPMPGKAYVFVEPNGGWVDMTQTAELTPSDGFDSKTSA